MNNHRCRRCEADPLYWHAAPFFPVLYQRVCSFREDGSFTPEGERCATLDALLTAAKIRRRRTTDPEFGSVVSIPTSTSHEAAATIAVLPEGETAPWVLVLRYSNVLLDRDREGARIPHVWDAVVGTDTWGPMTQDVAERAALTIETQDVAERAALTIETQG